MKTKKINLKKNSKLVHVVAAVIENTQGQVFIAKRPDHVHQGGLWEFPGGKVEVSETPLQALKRELFEEIGIQIQKSEPLIQIAHDYPDKSVFLDIWRISTFSGQAHGKEGQETRWVYKNELKHLDFPAANMPIINATLLPQHYLITPEPDLDRRTEFLENIENRLKNGTRLMQLRAKTLPSDQLNALYKEIQEINQSYNAAILVNSTIEIAQALGADGVHLSSTELLNTTIRPGNMLCSASCHNETEINIANKLGLDFIVLSPVLTTPSHPEAPTLGWEKFKSLCKISALPTYALGGMEIDHLPKALKTGAQGIAGIRALWCNS